MADGGISAVYLPPSGRSTAPLHYATGTTPLSVKQLPIPAVPTPLPAVLAPISGLRTLPNDAQAVTELPVLRHVLYHIGGALYSQALRGGPAVHRGYALLSPHGCRVSSSTAWRTSRMQASSSQSAVFRITWKGSGACQSAW